jgi:hypothetical protein
MRGRPRLPDETERPCKTCGVVKPLSEFAPGALRILADGTRKRYPMHECKACHTSTKAAINKRWREKNKGKRPHKPNPAKKKPIALKEPKAKRSIDGHDWDDRPKPRKHEPLQMDVLTLVEEIRTLIGADCKAQERLTRYLDMAGCEDTKAVGRGAIMMMLNDAKRGVR